MTAAEKRVAKIAAAIEPLFLELYGYQDRFEKIESEVRQLEDDALNLDLGTDPYALADKMSEVASSLNQAAFYFGNMSQPISDTASALEDALSLIEEYRS